jgi:3-hydroxyisobutyrate dehydrogenase-like beta-hydroxyacid dehydrogenase
MSLSVGYLGFGEIGFALAKGMQAAGAGPLVAFDKQAKHGPLADVIGARAGKLGIPLTDDARPLGDSEVVLSAVTPMAAVAAATAFAPHARRGQFYLDVNSSAPTMKQEIDALLRPRGVRVVDASMSGTGVHIRGHKGLYIYLSGPDSQALYDKLQPYDLEMKVLGGEIGAASALKMVRGVMMKGVEGLMVEMLLTAERFGVGAEVLASVVQAMDDESFNDFGAFLVKSHMIHSGRRGDELSLIRETVVAAGIDPVMTEAALKLFRRDSSSGVAEHFHGEMPKTWQAAIAELSRRLPPKA